MNTSQTVHTRAPYWQNVPDEQWQDWRWQMSHRLNTVAELGRVINLTESEKKALEANDLFRVDITPYFASLIDPDDIHCPVRKQVIPTDREVLPYYAMMDDSLAEDKHSPVPGLVHRYPDRVLMLITTQCASYCRYCTRSRIVGNPTQTFSRHDFDAQIAYIEETPQIRDVLISGGDPLVLAPKQLDMILSRLRAIPHVEIVRIGSRVPVFLPQRITAEFCETLAKYHPIWVNIHVNHPKEITPELAAACDRLSRAGVPLGNQSVLLAGVNDSVHIQRQLVHELVKMRVRPYYLYQCDLVKGAGHFRTTVSKGIEIIEGLRGHTSGYAIPTYVVDAPGGGGKIPVQPQYLISQGSGKVVLRNFEGFITTYIEPTEYDPTEVLLQPQPPHRLEPGQEGVFGLLEGQRLAIEPEGFDQTHARGGEEHRLRSGTLNTKWQPLGVGALPGKTPELTD
ncbi:MAG: lysine 2,3-aminomutase [Ardenticatenaceae bacterium]|nr:lysine 2,3-aminomutase [Ardenticatenaceae bacterium]MCB8946314.1 lysine 2,3-aminomutase [Ardenticatenaceae bacterium]